MSERLTEELARDVAAYLADDPRPGAHGRLRALIADEAWLPPAALAAACAAAPEVPEATLRGVLLAVYALPCGSCHPCDHWGDYAQLVYATAEAS